jgi:hypothetical protein
MRLPLTSARITNESIREALVDLLGKQRPLGPGEFADAQTRVQQLPLSSENYAAFGAMDEKI